MEPTYKLVSQCMKCLENCPMDIHRKMQLEIYFYRLKRMLLTEKNLKIFSLNNSDYAAFEKLLIKSEQASQSPHNHDAIVDLENHVTALLAEFEPNTEKTA